MFFLFVFLKTPRRHLSSFLEHLISQYYRLESLAGVLQVVAPQTLHERNSTAASHDTHSMAWWLAGEWIKGGMWVSRAWKWCLEWASVGQVWSLSFKIEGPLGSRVDKLFGIG